MSSNNNLNFRAIFSGVAIGIVTLAVITAGVWGMYLFFRQRNSNVDVRQTSVSPEKESPAEPPLQVSPRLEWRDFHQQQLDTLNSYGWTSREQGKVRIPIGRAMELLVERSGQ